MVLEDEEEEVRVRLLDEGGLDLQSVLYESRRVQKTPSADESRSDPTTQEGQN